MNCGNCIFYEGTGGKLSKGSPSYGLCHRYPPAYNRNTILEESKISGINFAKWYIPFPVTTSFEWCGEHKGERE